MFSPGGKFRFAYLLGFVFRDCRLFLVSQKGKGRGREEKGREKEKGKYMLSPPKGTVLNIVPVTGGQILSPSNITACKYLISLDS